jgi:cytidylate kinase
MPVVTLTGSMASGARDIGPTLAARLGVDFVDQQLMVRAAQRCGVSVGAVAARDERYASFGERISSAINRFLERSAAAGADPLTGTTGLEAILARSYTDLTEESEEITDDIYLEAMTTIIRELGAQGKIVILGRAGQMILADTPSALHVLCLAPFDTRAMRHAERQDISINDARREVTEGDRDREAFYRKHWKVDVNDPGLYDLCVDTSRLSYEIATEVIARAAELKSGDPRPTPGP